VCGICGVVNVDRSQPVELNGLLAMREAIRHRGPDQAGYYLAPGVGLGHRRLSIIDLRPEGRQPMTNEDRTIWLVFNGEIYNFREEREWLLERGHVFRSMSDTEVIIHLYEELGVECLRRLRGMFAFALWDEPRRRLFIARDRLGKKPLFYQFDGRRLLFGSEAKSIVCYPEVVAEPDYAAIHDYLTLGYVPSPRAGFRGMSKLPPAHYLLFEGGRVTVENYWRLSYTPKMHISEADAVVELRRRLDEAVRIRMVSDVPLGAFLSGGVDSTAVVAFMSRHSSRPVKTFSIVFPQAEYDESRFSRMAARTFATEHHEFTVEPEDAASLLGELSWYYDEPYADSSAIPTFYLSKMTRQHVTVALNGDAGDENFAGYRRYAISLLSHRLRLLPASVRRILAKTFARGYAASRINSRLARRLRMLDEILGGRPEDAYIRMVSYFNQAEKEQLYFDGFGNQEPGRSEDWIRSLYSEALAENELDAALSVDIHSYLPEDLLVKVDRASMAFALEARSPMIDHEFMEFAARLPAKTKMSLGRGKRLFKAGLRGIVPDEILYRSKMGFGAPLDYWMRGNWRELLNDVLLSRQATERGYFRPAALSRLIAEHVSGQRDRQAVLWALLMLEMWHRNFTDHPPGPRALNQDLEHLRGEQAS
jgi:asparagine synthase (glutamine-hydrolysing)